MPKRKAGYEEMFEDVVEALKHSPDEVNHVFETSEKVVEAANDLTKDELALVSAYVKSDLKEFADSYEESKGGLFILWWQTLSGRGYWISQTEQRSNGLNCLLT